MSLAVLECRHLFHVQCLFNWFHEGVNSCPCCRHEIEDLPVEGEGEDDSQSIPETVSIYSSEGEEDEESLENLHLQVSVTEEGERLVYTTAG